MSITDIATHPYPHLILPNALDNIEEIIQDFPKESCFSRSIRMHGDLTAGDDEYEKLIVQSNAYRKLHNFIYSEAFIKLFLSLFQKNLNDFYADGSLLANPFTLPINPHPFEGRNLLFRKNINKTSSAPFLFPRFDIGIGKLGYGKENGGGGIHVDNLTRIISVLVYVDDNSSMVGSQVSSQ